MPLANCEVCVVQLAHALAYTMYMYMHMYICKYTVTVLVHGIQDVSLVDVRMVIGSDRWCC
jgi:hypothetical protein